jgi:UDP-xylose/UDP-N-acetylglucosamine transporter B4
MHMVFRSSNLMVSYLYGFFLLRKRYTWQQLAAVALLTLGALCATWAEMSQGDTAAAAAKPCANCGDSAAGGAAASAGGAGGVGAGGWAAALFSDAEGGALYLLRWWMGIGILVLVLGLQTRLGALQEACKTKYGENPFEMLFFFHLFSLPAFFFCVRVLDAQRGVALWANVPSLLDTLGRWSASHSLERELALNWGVSTLGQGWGLFGGVEKGGVEG